MFEVLYVSYDGILEPLGSSQIIPYLKGLSKKGVKYSMLSYEKQADLSRYGDVLKLEKELASHGIKWKRLKYHKSPPVISTFFDVLYGCIVSFWLIKKNRIKIIHARSYVASLIALILKKVCKVRFIFDMRGFWADERVEGGIWKSGSLLYRTAKYFERKFLWNSDGIISLTYAGKAEIENFSSLNKHRVNINVIPTCVDLTKFNLEGGSTLIPINAHNINNKFVLIYIGSISTWYMPYEMIDYFYAVQKYIEGAHFLVLTKEKILFEDILKTKKFNSSTISILNAGHELISSYLLLGKVGIAFYKPGYSRKACCPTKFGEYLACGLPVIINSGIGDCDDIILKERVGVIINEFSLKEYERAIIELMKLLDEGDALKKRCRETAEKYFSLEMGVERYRDIYSKLLRG